MELKYNKLRRNCLNIEIGEVYDEYHIRLKSHQILKKLFLLLD
jgi:hypothetical protein